MEVGEGVIGVLGLVGRLEEGYRSVMVEMGFYMSTKSWFCRLPSISLKGT